MRSWREASLNLALVVWAWLVLTTEGLSLIHQLHGGGITTVWGLLLLGLVGYGWQNRRFRLRFSIKFRSWPLEDQVLLGGVALIVVILAVIAGVAPPNTWDSMSYHLPRIMQWLQQGSLAHYPTANLRQLYQAPGAEYAMLHLYAWGGGDFLLNFVQWGSMVGSLIAISLIAQQLGAGLTGQVYGMVFAATLPMGILQATSTKNDYLCGFWLLCVIYFTLIVWRQPRPTAKILLKLSASLGFLFLTKSTGYLFALPWILALLWKHWRSVATPLGLFAGLPLLIPGGHYLRNWQLFGSPFATGDHQLINSLFTPIAVLSNLSKNIALHLPISYNTVPFVNRLITAFHQILGISADDPRLNWQGSSFTTHFSTSEADAGNPLHLYLILTIFSLLLLKVSCGKSLDDRRIAWQMIRYGLTIVGSFVLFSGLLQWQVWHSRLHLPLFVAIAPLIGSTLAASVKPRLSFWIMMFLLIFSSLWLFWSETKPVFSSQNIFNIPREEQYFMMLPYSNAYQETMDYLAGQGCDRLGLKLGEDDWEYPFWALSRSRFPTLPQFRHVLVENSSQGIENQEEFRPCGIIQITLEPQSQLTTHWGSFLHHWQPPSDQGIMPNSAIHLYEPEDHL